MRGSFDRSTRWPRALDPQRLWSFVLDEEALAACSPHVEDVTPAASGQAWSARLVSRVGRLSFSAPVDVRVCDQATGRYVEIEAHGRDPRMGTRLAVQARLELVRDAPAHPGAIRPRSTPVDAARLAGHYAVRGKAANLAPGVVSRHAEMMVDAFWERFTEQAARTAGPGRQ